MLELTIPEDITIVNLADPDGRAVITEKGTPLTWSFRQYLIQVVLPDQAFGADLESQHIRFKIMDLLKDAKPGDVVGIDDDWQARLERVVKKPTQKLTDFATALMIPMQLREFALAIERAKLKEYKPLKMVPAEEEATA